MTYSKETVRNLMKYSAAAFRDGNEAAFMFLYKQTVVTVYCLTRTYEIDLINRPDAIQQVYFNVIKSIGKYDEKKSFYNWLYTIAKSSLSTIRKKNMQQRQRFPIYDEIKELGFENITDMRLTAVEILEREELHKKINDFVNTRPPRMQQIVKRIVNKEKHQDIAKDMGISVSTVGREWRNFINDAMVEPSILDAL